MPPTSGNEGRPGRSAEVPPAPLGPSEVTGSAVLAPPVPRGDVVPKSEKDPVKPSSKVNTRPMTPAKPIETPKPGAPIEAPPRPRED